MALKHIAEMKDFIARKFPGAEFELESGKKHYVLKVKWRGKTAVTRLRAAFKEA